MIVRKKIIQDLNNKGSKTKKTNATKNYNIEEITKVLLIIL
jgi:hypothetical protein